MLQLKRQCLILELTYSLLVVTKVLYASPEKATCRAFIMGTKCYLVLSVQSRR